LDRNLSVNLNVRDLLNPNKNKTTASGIEFGKTSEIYFNNRKINLSISYNFGNRKPKKTDLKKKDNSSDRI